MKPPTPKKVVIPDSYPRVPGESEGATLRRYLRDYPKGQLTLDLLSEPPQGEEGKAVRWDD